MLHARKWQSLMAGVAIVFCAVGWAQEEQPADPFVQGVDLVRSGRYEEAEQLLQQVVEASPDNEPAWYYLGVARFRRGNNTGALEAFVKARDLAPGRPGPTFFIGQVYERQGAYEEALRAYQRELALRRGRDEGEVYCAIGRTYALMGRLDDASEALMRTLRMEEHCVEAMYWFGQVLVAQGKYEEAEKMFDRARSTLQDWQDAKRRLESEPTFAEAEYARTTNEPKVAQTYYWAEQFGAVLSMWPDLNKARGDMYLAWKRWADARNAYRKALARDEGGNPDDPDVYVRISRAYLGDAKEVLEKDGLVYTAHSVTLDAIKAANKAIELNAKYAPAYCALGEVYAFQAETFISDPERKIESHAFEQAIEQFKQALTLDENYVDALLGLADAQVNLGHQKEAGSAEAVQAYAEAVRALEKAVTLAPERADVHAALARAYLAADRIDEALAEADESLKRDAKNVVALNTAGSAYYYRGQLAQAAEYFDRAIKADPRYAQTYVNLGNTYFQMKSWYRAREAYRQALELLPTAKITTLALQRARIYYAIGLCYDQTLDYDNEIEALSEAIFLDDTLIDAYLQIARAYAARGDDRAAEQALRIAVQKAATDEDRVRAYVQLGQTLEQARKQHDAVAAYTAAANIDANNPLVQDAL
ncbi:MAG: tetratricopeptide repeat protein, partial [Armatimonadota bacterium]